MDILRKAFTPTANNVNDGSFFGATAQTYNNKNRNNNNKNEDPESIFVIIQTLWKGRLCTIKKALDKRDGEIVSLKIIQMEDNTQYDNIHIESFQHIIELLKSRTKSSLYLVKFKGLWLENNQIWIASEFCGGGSISTIMKITKQPLKEYQIQVIIKEILKGLEYIHKYKSIHRAIKAQHIYIDQKGQCKISYVKINCVIPSNKRGKKCIHSLFDCQIRERKCIKKKSFFHVLCTYFFDDEKR